LQYKGTTLEKGKSSFYLPGKKKKIRRKEEKRALQLYFTNEKTLELVIANIR